ncbi:MAG: phosphate ABC transporter permease PstA [Hyphomicrobiaceae bacterium]|nr:phosphate ABC transporter permease PstA [Hyphomicrobiaceae bacterium]
MTDLTADTGPMPISRPDHGSEAAQLRLRARHRAERRFRSYGMIALAITCLFVVAVIGDVLRRGLPSFWTHSLVLDVTVPTDAISDADRANPQAVRGIDFFPITRDALKAAIPGIEGRNAQRALARLISTGAAEELVATLVAKPDLIGKPVKTRLLLSDEADMYLKGLETPIRSRVDTKGVATPSAISGEVVLTGGADDFVAEYKTAKDALKAKARELRAEADRVERRAGGSAAEQVKQMRDDAAVFEGRAASTAAEALDTALPSILVAINGGVVKLTEITPSSAKGETLLPLAGIEPAKPGAWKVVTYLTPEANRKITDQEVAFLERFREIGAVDSHFNTRFFTAGDSREPELAGIRGSLMGTVLTLAITLVLALFFGVMAAVYLEEFAPRNWFTELIEININNLAAVPSIVFGLLGLAVFLNFIGLPRSAPLVGGLVLALLVLPTIIVASRAALKAVPPSIREAALGIGASKQQAVFHHVLPLAMPGIMTGTIIGMAHALGETAPLLMIGMIAFIVDVPGSFTEAATVLPVQIYLWSDLPEVAFQAKTAGAIIVLLGVLFAMNGLAIFLRKKFERRW